MSKCPICGNSLTVEESTNSAIIVVGKGPTCFSCGNIVLDFDRISFNASPSGPRLNGTYRITTARAMQVKMNIRRQGNKNKNAALYISPQSPIPIPYPNTGTASDTYSGPAKVKISSSKKG